MAKKKGKSRLDYYEAFLQQAKLAHAEAELLVEVAQGFTDAKAVGEYLPRAHEVENRADEVNHAVMRAIDVDFITPIDRNDIIELSNALDDITDAIEEVVQRFYLYDVRFMHRDVLPLAKLLRKATNTLVKALDGYEGQKKFAPFLERMEKVDAVEEEVDAAYMEVMRRLYTSEHDNPVRLMVWSDIFERIEDAADRIDEAAVLMGNIILRNS